MKCATCGTEDYPGHSFSGCARVMAEEIATLKLQVSELGNERKLLLAHIEEDQKDLERVTEDVERWQESNAYDHQKMDEFAREFFGDQEHKTWEAGFTLGKLLEMVRDKLTPPGKPVGECLCDLPHGAHANNCPVLTAAIEKQIAEGGNP